MPLSVRRIKKLVIATGLYRAARFTERHLVRRRTLLTYRRDLRFFRCLVPPGALCFDVGANIGEKTEALLEVGARVVSFEPHPELLAELRARCSRYPNWTLVSTALGSRAAIATLHVRESHGQSSLDAHWEGRPVGAYGVPVVTLGCAIERYGTPYYCKIDVEGWEFEVLSGLTQPIPVLSFEYHLTPSNIEQTQACLERLRRFGEAAVNITPAEGVEYRFDAWMPLADFVSWFPGDLHDAAGFHYGDIVVKRSIGA